MPGMEMDGEEGKGEGGSPAEAGVDLELRVAPGSLLLLLELVLQVFHSQE